MSRYTKVLYLGLFLGVATHPWAAQTSLDAAVRFREALFVQSNATSTGTELSLLMNLNEALPQLTQCAGGVCHTFIPHARQLERLMLRNTEHSPFSMQVSYF